jgi:hypothetical protein
MGNVVIDMSMSLDGYIAAPKDHPEQGLGEDGMGLHSWAFDDPSVFERVYGNLVEETAHDGCAKSQLSLLEARESNGMTV